MTDPMKDSTDISSEEFRVYKFPANEEVRIDNPLQLKISGGGHRIIDGQGISHYVPKGWVHLFWKARDGQPKFVA